MKLKKYRNSKITLIHQSEILSSILKTTWDPGKNRDVREILRNLIGCLEVLELEKSDRLRDYGKSNNRNLCPNSLSFKS